MLIEYLRIRCIFCWGLGKPGTSGIEGTVGPGELQGPGTAGYRSPFGHRYTVPHANTHNFNKTPLVAPMSVWEFSAPSWHDFKAPDSALPEDGYFG